MEARREQEDKGKETSILHVLTYAAGRCVPDLGSVFPNQMIWIKGVSSSKITL